MALDVVSLGEHSRRGSAAAGLALPSTQSMQLLQGIAPAQWLHWLGLPDELEVSVQVGMDCMVPPRQRPRVYICTSTSTGSISSAC